MDLKLTAKVVHDGEPVMTILETKKVDFIGIDKKSQEIILTISDHLEWVGGDQEHQLLLQEKLNSYLRFIESGEIYETYPNAKGRPIVIQVVGKFDIPQEVMQILEESKQVIKGAGFELRFSKFEP